MTKFVSPTRVELTTPVNPAKENAMLALHCQIWDLNDSQTVTIYRVIGGQTEDLTYGEDLLASVDDRVYLARRILSDGSVVYFLSIMGVNKKDQGQYYCEVLSRQNEGSSRVLSRNAIDDVEVRVYYYPEDTYPMCTTKAPQIIYTGTRIVLNCTSESGFPLVSLSWKRTRTHKETKTIQIDNNGTSYAELAVDVTLADQNDIFLCEMKSTAFPEHKGKTCHIGPFKIMQNPDHSLYPVEDSVQSTDNINVHDLITKPNKIYTDASITKDKKHCQKLCSSSMSSNLSVWRMATLIAGALAFVLLIIGLTLYVKIYQETAYRKRRQAQQLAPSRQPIDCLYEELKSRQDFEGNKVYMALVRPRKPDSLAVPVTNMTIEPEGNYTLTPTTFNVNTVIQQ